MDILARHRRQDRAPNFCPLWKPPVLVEGLERLILGKTSLFLGLLAAQSKTSTVVLTIADGVESLAAQPVGGQKIERLEQNEGDGQGNELLAATR